jgi:hypothetical protein
VCISTYIIAVLIFGTYSATFISFLAVHESRLPYTDLKSLMEEGGYTFGLSSTHAKNYISEVWYHASSQRLQVRFRERSSEKNQ